MAKKILIVDDEPDLLTVITARLRASGYEVSTATSCREAFDAVRAERPDLILLDVMMPSVDGFETKEMLNKDASTAEIPVIFLTAKDAIGDKIKGFKLGIDDYITKPYVPEELLARIDSAINRRGLYEKISMTDGLTGLYNAAFFKEQIKKLFAIAKRYRQVFSLALIDIDDLKRINDTYGHAAGDRVLASFANTARKVLRDADIVTRYGGDEFAVLLPNISRDQASIAMERLNNELRDNFPRHDGSGQIMSFSVSIGIAEYAHDLKDEHEMFEAADAEMYKDKRGKARGR